MKRHHGWSLFLIMLATGLVHAQDHFFLQAEASQGLFFAPRVDPYTFSAQVHPSLGIGASPRNFLLGASLAGVYNNPDWALLWGSRLVLHITKLQKKPINRGPRVTYGTLHLTGAILWEGSELRRLAGGVMIDVWEGALLINPRLGYDRKSERKFLEVGLGMGF
ncbi:MAG: hypothetical protein ALAOOOJD_03596 [bacterium]|nr:hypothetical protein [bacterium]